MKIIISPAKKLSDQKINNDNHSPIQFSDEAEYLVEKLRDYSIDDIKKLMGLSDSLAELNYNRFQQWDLKSNDLVAAIYMFQGDVYKGIKAKDLSEDDIAFAQENLRIISGLYGLLKPLDKILPYRLEMGTNLKTKYGNNLYQFWKNKLSKALSSQMNKEDVLVNLASSEYSKALNLNNLSNKIVTPVFKDYKNGKLKVISFFAKKARGEMVNFIIKNKISDPKYLVSFDNNGYKFHDENNGDILFVR
jgi:cytoplasmic iron level regulating protein YaaA (DUF328/UPF0246 family)